MNLGRCLDKLEKEVKNELYLIMPFAYIEVSTSNLSEIVSDTSFYQRFYIYARIRYTIFGKEDEVFLRYMNFLEDFSRKCLMGYDIRLEAQHIADEFKRSLKDWVAGKAVDAVHENKLFDYRGEADVESSYR